MFNEDGTWLGLKPNPAPNVLANLQQNQKGEMKKHNQTQFWRSSTYFEKKENIKAKKGNKECKGRKQ